MTVGALQWLGEWRVMQDVVPYNFGSQVLVLFCFLAVQML